MRISATTAQLKVAFRKADKFYGQPNGELDHFDDGTCTSHPFDEQLVEAGQSFDLPAGAELVFVKEMGVGSNVEMASYQG